MQKHTRNNRYKYDVGDVVYIIINDKRIVELTIEKRLKRPYRLSDNFYYCSWDTYGCKKYGIKYEQQIYPDYEAAYDAFISIKNGNIFN